MSITASRSRLGFGQPTNFGGSIADNFKQNNTLFQPTATVASTSPALASNYSFLNNATFSMADILKGSQLISQDEARAMDNARNNAQQAEIWTARQQKESSKTVIGIVLIVILGIGAYFAFKQD